MDYERTLHWYRQDGFTADDVTRATGLSERSQRELLKLGILDPIPQAKTKQRLLRARTVKRAAVIAHLNRSGLSLGVAGRIVYAAMMLEDLVFDDVDPWEVHYDAATEFDPKTGLFQPRKLPHFRDKWFDPAHPPRAENNDFFIAVLNSRFVASYLGGDGTEETFNIYGELTPDLTDFVWWNSGMFDIIRNRVGDDEVIVSARGWHDHAKAPFGLFDTAEDPRTITFKAKTETEEDQRAGSEAKENPVSMLKINASLALRIALRRLLHLDELTEN